MSGFSLLGPRRSSFSLGLASSDPSFAPPKPQISPSLDIDLDSDVHRPGDWVSATIHLSGPNSSDGSPAADETCLFLVESLSFELKGVEKLDAQWFVTQRPMPGSKQRRGEHVFLDCTAASIVSKVIVSSGCTRTYIVRVELPKVIPPSYRGATVRYFYYARSTLRFKWMMENGHSHAVSTNDILEVETRAPIQIWASQKSGGLLSEEGVLPGSTIQMDIYWKEKDVDSDWVRANEIPDEVDEGYESSKDEISSVSSHNATRGNIDTALRNSLSLQSPILRSSIQEFSNIHGERSSLPSPLPPRLSVAEVLHDPVGDTLLPEKMPIYSSSLLSPSHQKKHATGFINDETGIPSTPRTVDPAASEGFVHGRSYNIRMDNHVLLRFSPKNSDSNYYFGDAIGGTLTFFHEDGARRCLEVSITLETSENIGQHYVHPSRRNSSTITKIQSDHHEVVADLVQTSFLFSIPMDGPMSFSTPHVSVRWALRFEFFTTPKNVDWTRYEHPLLIEQRDKCEWILPITVHAPSPRTQVSHARSNKPFSLWAHT